MRGTTSPTTRRAHAPIGGEKTVWPESPTTSSSSACARAVERQRSDHQGAPLRPHQQRGQSRRRRQGVLLLPRFHADALVHEVSVQVSAGGVSRTTISSRPTGTAAARDCEYELLDTGVFDDNRYFDVFVEYAKASPEDLLIEITVHNRGPEPATLHVLPTLWFRNTWSWGGDGPRPELVAGRRRRQRDRRHHIRSVGRAAFSTLMARPDLLFTENETNNERIFSSPNRSALRQGRDQRLHRPRPSRGGESEQDRDQGGGALSLDRRGGGIAGRAAAIDATWRRPRKDRRRMRRPAHSRKTSRP